jgi:hypothetical protein
MTSFVALLSLPREGAPQTSEYDVKIVHAISVMTAYDGTNFSYRGGQYGHIRHVKHVV